MWEDGVGGDGGEEIPSFQDSGGVWGNLYASANLDGSSASVMEVDL